MESIHCPTSFPSIPSSLSAKQHTEPRRTHATFITRKPVTPHSLLRARALVTDAIAVAANTAAVAAPHRGDISVLIPVSAVLLFMYWIANFVVPGFVLKDLQQKAQEGEETPEQPAIVENAMRGPMKKLKKADLKRMINDKTR